MRPVELVFRGINSYTDEARIDFKKLHEKGIFGIFGETGAGKTTILDAITIALYSRTDRLNSISEVTNPSVGRIYVRFKFEMNGRLYEVYREFVNGNAKTQALYEYVDYSKKPLADKARDINEYIREKIIGLDFDDFTKVVILPQGKFSKFLDAGPAEKTRILGKIFGTDIYGEKLFNAVKTRRDVVRGNIETFQKSYDEMKDLTEEKIKELIEEQEKIKREIAKLKEEREKLEKRLKTLEKLAELLSEKKEIEKEIESLKQKESEIKKLREKLEIAEKLSPYAIFVSTIEDSKRRKVELEVKVNGLEIQLLSLKPQFEKKKKEWEDFIHREYPEVQSELRLRIENARKAKEKLKTLQELRKKLSGLNADVSRYQKQLKDLSKIKSDLEDVKSKIVRLKLSPQDEKLLGLESRISSLKTEYIHTEDELKKLKDKFEKEKSRISSAIKNILKSAGLPEDSEDPIKALAKILNETVNAKEKTERLLKEKEHMNLAVTLVQDLKEGEPCPVCGSIHHPNPAREKVEDKEIKKLKDEIKKLYEKERILIQLQTEAGKLKEDLKIAEENYEREKSRILQKIKNLKNEGEKIAKEFECHGFECLIKKIDTVKLCKKEIEKLTEMERTLNEKFQDLHEIKEKLTISEAEFKQTHELIQRIEGEIKELIGDNLPGEVLKIAEKELTQFENRKKRLFSDFQNLKKKFEALDSELTQNKGFLTETERNLKENIEKLEETAKKLNMTTEELKRSILPEQEIEKLKKWIRDYEKNLGDLQARLNRTDKELQKLPIKELSEKEPDETRENLAKISEKLDFMNFRLGEIGKMIEEGKTKLEKKKELAKAISENKRIEGYLSELYTLFHGKKFSKFVSRFYLSEIIHEANNFLLELTGGRLKIVGTKGDEIEFQIFDSFTGHVRSTKSLSGGERFLVSFSLAISFSLYIQRRNTKSIDFFFIDEGFGTLDEDLQDAMGRVFEQIQRTGKLVGLITHVRKFRELVPAQIIVTRDPVTKSSKIQMQI